MKHVIFVLLCVFTYAAQCARQSDTAGIAKKVNFGGNLGGMATMSAAGIVYFLNVSAQKDNHFLSFGPVRSIVDGQSNNPAKGYKSQKYEFTGVNLCYQFRPNSRGKVFDFYFLANMLILRFKELYPVNYYQNPNYSPYTIKRASVEAHAGYGFRFKFTKKLYISNFVGVGYFRESYFYDYETKNKEDFGALNSQLGAVINFSLGFLN